MKIKGNKNVFAGACVTSIGTIDNEVSVEKSRKQENSKTVDQAMSSGEDSSSDSESVRVKGMHSNSPLPSSIKNKLNETKEIINGNHEVRFSTTCLVMSQVISVNGGKSLHVMLYAGKFISALYIIYKFNSFENRAISVIM